jgi:hypothetical protein
MATGVSLGTVAISYTLPTGCSTSMIFTVTPTPIVYTLTGGGSYCSGGTGVTIGLSGSQAGVSYQLHNGAFPVGAPVTGTGAAISFGLIASPATYTAAAYPGTSCSTAMASAVTVTVTPLPTVYTLSFAGGGYCAGGSGSTLTLSGSQTGVDYQLYMGSTPIGTPAPGTGSSLSWPAMTTAGTYFVRATDLSTGCMSATATATLAIHPLPTVYSVTGGGSYCAGGSGVTIGLSSSDAGVSYQLIAGSSTAGPPITGTGSAISFGLHTSAGSYTVVATNTTTMCTNNMSGSATVAITPISTPSVTVTASPGATVCAGTTVTFSGVALSAGVTPSYQWQLNGTPITGAIGSSYTSATLVTGDVIEVVITSSSICVTTSTAISAPITMTVGSPTITTSSTYPCGGAETITASGGVTYSWSPSTGLSCSTCGVTDATPTTATTYTVTGTDGSGCSNTATVTVIANRIAGQITYTGGSSTDVFKVWLIQFNPSDSSITALDSTSSCMISGTTPYYEFPTPAAGSYLVKAKLNGTVAGTSGYIPTYYTSTPNWYAATSIAHTSSRDIANISMVYGTVPSGPGFISGYVAFGAGKGTSGDIPEPGMLIYLYNSTGSMITYTYTDATGNYSFTGLANGTYFVYPEEHKYYTTPSATITLSASSPSASGISFRKSTTLGTIKPYDYTRILTATAIGTIAVYPVPTSRYLHINWPVTAAANTAIIVRDMQGRTVYNASIDPTTANGHSALDFSHIPGGVYHITISSTDLFYASKLVVAH